MTMLTFKSGGSSGQSGNFFIVSCSQVALGQSLCTVAFTTLWWACDKETFNEWILLEEFQCAISCEKHLKYCSRVARLPFLG